MPNNNKMPFNLKPFSQPSLIVMNTSFTLPQSVTEVLNDEHLQSGSERTHPGNSLDALFSDEDPTPKSGGAAQGKSSARAKSTAAPASDLGGWQVGEDQPQSRSATAARPQSTVDYTIQKLATICEVVGTFTTDINDLDKTVTELTRDPAISRTFTQTLAAVSAQFRQALAGAGRGGGYHYAKMVAQTKASSEQYLYTFMRKLPHSLNSPERPAGADGDDIVRNVHKRAKFVTDINYLCDTACTVFRTSAALLKNKVPMPSQGHYEYSGRPERAKEEFERGLAQAFKILHIDPKAAPLMDSVMCEDIETFRRTVVAAIEPY